jgi:hypothetical protein
MKARLLDFGRLEIDGRRYEHDVVIDGGRIRKRHKGPSKPYRDDFGHTPLSPDEALPWGCRQLVIGTGADGQLPVMPEVMAEARRRGVTVVAVPTEEACRLIGGMPAGKVHAILHVTC